MKLLCVGDIHGLFESFYNTYKQIKETEQFDAIIQVGDFGMWHHSLRDWYEIEEPIYFVRGNHEEYTRGAYPTRDDHSTWEYEDFFNKYPEGFEHYFGENIPKHVDGDVFELDDVVFCGVGGAESHDKEWRLLEQQRNKYKRSGQKLWWKDESVKPEVVEILLSTQPVIDVMFSHDVPSTASNRIHKFQSAMMNGDLMLGTLYSGLLNPPMLWLFGHYHDWTYFLDDRTNTVFIGLPTSDVGYAIYDTETRDIKVKVLDK